MATRLSAWQVYWAMLLLLHARVCLARSSPFQFRSNFPPYPQAAASTIAIQNASVNDVFKKMWPLLRKSRILSWFTAPSIERNEEVFQITNVLPACSRGKLPNATRSSAPSRSITSRMSISLGPLPAEINRQAFFSLIRHRATTHRYETWRWDTQRECVVRHQWINRFLCGRRDGWQRW